MDLDWLLPLLPPLEVPLSKEAVLRTPPDGARFLEDAESDDGDAEDEDVDDVVEGR